MDIKNSYHCYHLPLCYFHVGTQVPGSSDVWVKKDHTAEHIAASFPKVAEEWGISRKVVAMVSDNAANIVAAVRHTGWTHVPCFAHTLNLVVSEAIKAETKIHQLRKSCRDIVSFFHFSIEASEKLKEIQLQLGIPENKLIQEVKTRWNSTYYMWNASRSNIKPLPQHFVSLFVMQCVSHLLM